ncbi:hypothetical protein OIU76_006356 [Salix suchowensis]|nr:hypothetical protein OIU78_016250 [Salix suchowensis]KAJ6344809.1 hypothetical protein OIU76_006356 [Salix suchowensis]
MEKENSGSFEYMGRSFSELSVNDDSSAFSDCNSDRSGEFQTATSQNRRAVQAGIMKPLVELMADFGSNMVDKSAFVLSLLITVPEAKTAVVEEAGIPVLVEIVEVGSQRQKEIAVSILLQICEDNLVFRAMVTREGAIPPLVALTQSGTNRAKQKAETLIDLLRQPRSGNAAVGRTSDVSG